jgi:hypothetical protein
VTFLWSFWTGLIIALIGLVFFGGFARVVGSSGMSAEPIDARTVRELKRRERLAPSRSAV